MMNAFGILFGIALIGLVIAFLDWLGRRSARQSKSGPAA